MTIGDSRWVVCQIGAREHYAIARGLAEIGRLDTLVTDAWAPPNSLFAKLSPRLAGRFQPEFQNQHVKAFTASALCGDGMDRLQRKERAASNMRRNTWFQQKAVAAIRKIARDGQKRILFSYSYAALDIFREAKRLGWQTVLGQIDPGPLEARIVSDLMDRYDPGGPNEVAKPANYWRNWEMETELADWIVVNSDWSRKALISAGIVPNKIAIVPLAYEPPVEATSFVRERPREQPLRVLFLGQAIVRKGIVEMIEAAQLLQGQHVEIHVVGRTNPGILKRWPDLPNLFWHGAQPRSRVDDFYRQSDVFLLPTHSDGFALTQYEALATGLPVIASKNCGDVITDRINGLRIEDVSPEAICQAVMLLAEDRRLLAELSRGAIETNIPAPKDIATQMVSLLSQGA